MAYKMPYNWCCLFQDIKIAFPHRNWQFFLPIQYDFITTFPLEGNVIRKNDSACRRQRAKNCNGTLGTRLRKRTSVSKASFLLALWSILYMAWFEDLKMKRRTVEEDIFLFFLQLYFCEKYPVLKILAPLTTTSRNSQNDQIDTATFICNFIPNRKSKGAWCAFG